MVGDTISHYRLLDKVGEGGMGVVYKAEDTKLKRTTALKFLVRVDPHDEASRVRFLREAQAAAALNHPNICTIYEVDDEHSFIAMEYIEGRSLRDKIVERPLQLTEALQIAIDMAQGLQAAHELGIVHRDIKSGNILVTPKGQAKITDFGLAQLGGRTRLTKTGTTMGTAAYMSPEQSRGEVVDRRSDIWSLGVVLYEMISGRLPFLGDVEPAVIHSILTEEPEPLTAVRTGIPLRLDLLVQKALAKDPAERYQHIDELLVDLLAVKKEVTTKGHTPAKGMTASRQAVEVERGLFGRALAPRRLKELAGTHPTRERVAWALALIFLLVAAFAFLRHHIWPLPEGTRAIRFQVLPPEPMSLTGSIAVSPDGTRIAFAAVPPGAASMLHVRSLDSLEARVLPGTEGAVHPFWSPNGDHLGFFAERKLKKIRVDGGPSQTLCEVFDARGGSWSQQGVIIFSPNVGDRIYEIPETGGTVRPVTTVNYSRQESSHEWPHFLPDGNKFLYLTWSAQPDARGVFAGSLDGKTSQRVLATDWGIDYVTGPTGDGYLLFLRERTLMAQRFDPDSLKLSGEAVPVASQAWYDATTPGVAAFSSSGSGLLAYRSGAVRSNQLVWFDRGGKPLGQVGPPGAYRDPWLFPDDKRVVVARVDPQTGTDDIWLFEPQREVATRLTFHPSDETNPLTSPDGNRVMFVSTRNGPYDLFEKMFTGGASEQLVLKSEVSKFPTDWSRDGRFIVLANWDAKTKWDLWALPTSGDRKPVPVVQADFDSFQATLSPDSQWIAYASNESGRYEVVVQAFTPVNPKGVGRWQISTGGGAQPHWRGDGRELYYLAADQKLMAVDVKTGPSLDPSPPRPLFQTQVTGLVNARNHFVVSADGQRFLINSIAGESGISTIGVALNWAAGLK